MVAFSPAHEATGAARLAHVIVCGNEKGGTGKSTIAFHLAVALLRTGRRVATIDLDPVQSTLSRFIENRHSWAREGGEALPSPIHAQPLAGATGSNTVGDADAFRLLADALARVEHAAEFIVIDTPGHHEPAARIAHRLADTIITPVGESFLDLDAVGRTDAMGGLHVARSAYAAMVTEARRQRRRIDNAVIDWVIVRNRHDLKSSGSDRRLETSLRGLAADLAVRVEDGLSDRRIFRQLFPFGLTALDPEAAAALGQDGRLELLAARHEINGLVAAARLMPALGEGSRGAERRRLADLMSRPLDMPDIFDS
jgi:chromosome partitioning protein